MLCSTDDVGDTAAQRCQEIIEALDLVRNVHRMLDRIEYLTAATVSDAGQPWNTPLYFARQGDSFYWISRTDSQHTMNVASNGRAFLVAYDSTQEDRSGAAVYMDADVTELRDEESIASALQRIYQRKNKPVPPVERFTGSSPHRVYQAVARKAWTNFLHTSDNPPWDERIEIALTA